jgi:hypothetical protein
MANHDIQVLSWANFAQASRLRASIAMFTMPFSMQFHRDLPPRSVFFIGNGPVVICRKTLAGRVMACGLCMMGGA